MLICYWQGIFYLYGTFHTQWQGVLTNCIKDDKRVIEEISMTVKHVLWLCVSKRSDLYANKRPVNADQKEYYEINASVSVNRFFLCWGCWVVSDGTRIGYQELLALESEGAIRNCWPVSEYPCSVGSQLSPFDPLRYAPPPRRSTRVQTSLRSVRMSWSSLQMLSWRELTSCAAETASWR